MSKAGIVNEPEFRILNLLIKDGDVAIDIGANIGCYTYAISCLVGNEGKVIAVEPVKVNLEKLHYLQTKMRLKNLTIVSKAISNKVGEMRFAIPKIAGEYKTTRGYLTMEAANSEDSIKVPVTTIQELYEMYHLDRVDFIKCDVEGAEKMVFEGGASIISKHKPTILCEISVNKYGFEEKNIFLYIKNLAEYDSYYYSNGKLVQINEYNPDVFNYIFKAKA